MEDITYSSDISSMIKKTEACEYSDQPETLNIQGQLDSDNFHIHKILPMETIYGQTLLEFYVKADSIIALYIIKRHNVDYIINLSRGDDSNKVATGYTSIYAPLKPGTYVIEILYSSEYQLPSSRLCPGFEIDLSIIGLDEYKKITKQYSCTTSQGIPDRIKAATATQYMVFGEINKTI